MSMAIAYAMKKKMAKGGEVKGVHPEYRAHVGGVEHGQSKAGDETRWAQATNSSDTPRSHSSHLSKAKAEHHKVLSEMRSMPNPKLQGLAEGGEVCDESCEPNCQIHPQDMVSHIMKKRMMAHGGDVEDLMPEADFEENQFDVMPEDHMEAHNTGADEGDDLGNEYDADHDDMVGKIMMKRHKQKNPRPA